MECDLPRWVSVLPDVECDLPRWVGVLPGMECDLPCQVGYLPRQEGQFPSMDGPFPLRDGQVLCPASDVSNVSRLYCQAKYCIVMIDRQLYAPAPWK